MSAYGIPFFPYTFLSFSIPEPSSNFIDVSVESYVYPPPAFIVPE